LTRGGWLKQAADVAKGKDSESDEEGPPDHSSQEEYNTDSDDGDESGDENGDESGDSDDGDSDDARSGKKVSSTLWRTIT
jgi:hypothetical protein